MNELKQIRSMAEMILQKVDALEGATSFPQNGFREFVPEVNVWMPKFKVGDTVYYKPAGGDEEYECTISGIHPTYNSYKVVSHGGLYDYWVAEKFLRVEPAVKEPKFKVGDRVSWYDGLNNVSKGTVKAITAPAWSGHLPLYDVQSETDEMIHAVNEGRITKIAVEPMFKVGDRVVYQSSGEQGTVIDASIGSMGIEYIVWQPDNKFAHPHTSTPAADLVKAPKFKVGDRVRHLYNANTVGTIKKVHPGNDVPYFMIDDTDRAWANKEAELIKVESEQGEREWHSGPPPHIGWWNASNIKNLGAWRWWNGSSWSWLEYECSSDLATIGQTVNVTSNKSFKWTDYWPENARVQRIDPSN